MSLSDQHAAGLRDSVQAIDRATKDLYDLVVEIRRAGHSYNDIAEALPAAAPAPGSPLEAEPRKMSVTRQAAWERFHTYVEQQLGADSGDQGSAGGVAGPTPG